MRGVGAVTAAFEWTAGPFFWWYPAAHDEGVRIATGIFPVFLVAYEHGSPFHKRKKAGERRDILSFLRPLLSYIQCLIFSFG